MTSQAQVVLVHGYTGSGPEHWQTWLADELAREGSPALFPRLPDDHDPALIDWADTLRSALESAAPSESWVVLAHSLGCWLWVHLQRKHDLPRPDRTLLVAPPSPAWVAAHLSRFPAPRWADLTEVVSQTGAEVVIGSGDEFLPEVDRAALLEAAPGTREVPGGGHLHTAAGYGPWPAVRAWVEGDLSPLHAQSHPVVR